MIPARLRAAFAYLKTNESALSQVRIADVPQARAVWKILVSIDLLQLQRLDIWQCRRMVAFLHSAGDASWSLIYPPWFWRACFENRAYCLAYWVRYVDVDRQNEAAFCDVRTKNTARLAFVLKYASDHLSVGRNGD